MLQGGGVVVTDRVGGERGASLVGTLVVLVILGALAIFVVRAWPSGSPGTSATVRQLAAEANGVGSPAPAQPRPPTAVASTAACQASVRTVEQAAAAKRASDGTFPTGIAELVGGRWLAEMPSLPGYELSMESVGAAPTGRVLVNGRPADQGCAAPPRTGP